MQKDTRQWISWITLAALAVIWGSSFILIKKSLIYFTGVEVGLLRVTITFLFLLPIAIKKIRSISLREAFLLFIAGLIGSFIPAFMFAIAQTGINSSLAGTLNSLTPLFTLLLGLLFFRQKSRWFNVAGVIIGLVGALGLINQNGGHDFSFNFSYAALIIIATICYAFNVNFIKVYLKNLDAMAITSFTFFFIGIPTLLYVLIYSGIPTKLIEHNENLTGLVYVSILSVVGTGLAMIAFNNLIKVNSPLFASSVTYIIPIVAVIWGIFDGEVFAMLDIVWFLMILGGVFLVNAHPRRPGNISSYVLFRRNRKI